jgi:hypothetical protein
MTTLSKLREYRIYKFAALDLIGTIVIFYLISKYTDTNPLLTISGGLALGVVAHNLVGQKTPLNDLIKDLL